MLSMFVFICSRLQCEVRSLLRAVGLMALVFCTLAPAQAETLEKALEAYDFKEYQDAAQWLRPWADKGQVEAQYRLATLYENGQGVEKSLEEAKKWYRKAAAQNHSRARRRLEAIEGKVSSPGGESVALKWYQDLADHGEPDAQYNLGFMYETGFSVPKDDGKAAQWYARAAEKKNVPAQLRLGMMYLAGAGVKQSEIQASKWLQAAGARGNKLAAGIREQLLGGGPALPIDKAELANRLRQTSAKDDKKAFAMLTAAVQEARAKLENEKTEHDALLAKRKGIQSALDQETDVEFGLDAQGRRTIRWYQRSAERGSAEAQFQLGRYYELGREVVPDLKEAVRWYRSAAEQAYPDAQYYLGMLFYYGIGVDPDPVLASSLVKAASGQGHEKAKKALSNMNVAQSGNSQTMALWWLTRPGQEKNALAMRLAGSLYELGRGVHADINEARKYYQAANVLGFSAATQPAIPSTERVLATVVGEKRDAAAGSSREATTSNTPEPIIESRKADKQPKNPWTKYVPFVLVAILPIGAFAWFVAKEKKRMSKGQKKPAGQVAQPKPAKPAPPQRKPTAAPASKPPNPFR